MWILGNSTWIKQLDFFVYEDLVTAEYSIANIQFLKILQCFCN